VTPFQLDEAAAAELVAAGDWYRVVYGVVAGTLWVFAIAHLHRRPGYWRDRVSPG
jgi:hypothetical protein